MRLGRPRARSGGRVRWINELSTSGRISRQGFWLRHFLVLPVALFVCVAATDLLGSPLDLLPTLIVTVGLTSTWGRRLHDRGLSSWWLLAAVLPVLGALWLLYECGLRGTSISAARFGSFSGVPSDYATVGEESSR
ncbi:MAG: hypothetical protein C4K60_14630 [Ideonella sp. MAG2]|nr:MAG: hypothetical protein C4K60_14630 [Ideonella sp. MAG2]